MTVAALIAFASVAFGQYAGTDGTNAADTLTNADTLIVSFGDFNRQGTFEAIWKVDSLSGTPAGNVYVEYALDPSGTLWYTAETTSLSSIGASVSDNTKVTNFVGRKARIRVISSGTVSMLFKGFMAYREDR